MLYCRLLCCRRVPGQTLAGLRMTLNDRMRLPWRGGARRFDFTVVAPFILIPMTLMIAAYSLIWTCIMFVVVPVFLIYMLRVFANDPK